MESSSRQNGFDTAHFSAFVSYSHADAAIAKKLHRKIETYKLPKLLRAMQPEGQKNGRLGQVFRDREDLPAALDLSESVKKALMQSRALIVLCSPNTKYSPWVAKEIELFRELHPDRPILAALIAGEPEESFPDALIEGGEPLAADLRREGDGWRLGLLKLIAGVAEVPLDSLVQRDSQRHIRSVMAITGGVLIALLAMTGMTIFAVQQRNQAQHQQAQAEGLVEYMLTDLRTELKGVGRLDVMTNVNERAMDYYEGQGDLSNLPAESLERRARILHAMGEDDEKRGDLVKALEKFKEAHRVTETLLAKAPDNPNRIFVHGQSEYWVGRIAELSRNWTDAKLYYNAYNRAAIRLLEMEGATPRAMKEQAWGHLNLGIIDFRLSSYDAARNRFQRSVDIFTKLLAQSNESSSIQYELANSHSWLADTFFYTDKITKSLHHREISAELKHKVWQANTSNKSAQFDFLIEKRAVALHQGKLGRHQLAINGLRDASAEISTLVKVDPKNQVWAKFRANIQTDIEQLAVGEENDNNER